MAKKKDYSDEGGRWGRRFGKHMKEWGGEFGESMERLGKRMEDEFAPEAAEAGKRMGAKVRGEWSHHGCCCKECGMHRRRLWKMIFWPFGLLGPLFGSVAWLVMIIAGLWALKAANVALQSGFISLMIAAVSSNLHWFFAVSLLTGYLDFFARKFPPCTWIFRPVSSAVGTTFAAWIIAWVFRVLGAQPGAGFLSQLGVLLRENLLPIFAIVLALGMILALARKAFRGCCCG